MIGDAGYPAARLLEMSFPKIALDAMTSTECDGAGCSVDLQALGTLALIAVCINQPAIDGVVSLGGISVAVKNLQVIDVIDCTLHC